ncbi:MAG: hypothetical protein WKF97_01690 [Chitinophagaceae bacterium]
MKVKLLFLTISLIIAKSSFANELNFQFQRLSQELRKLKFKVEYQSYDRTYKLDSMQRLILRQKINTSIQNTLSLDSLANTKLFKINSDYLSDIADAADVIEQVNAANIIADTEFIKVSSVNEELRAKKSYADKKPSDPFSSIYIVVSTRGRDNKIIPGYEVWYVKKLFVNDSTHYNNFLKNSSPVAKDLPPGRYFFWSRLKKEKK